MAKKTVNDFIISLCADFCRDQKIPELMILKATAKLKIEFSKRMSVSEPMKIAMGCDFDCSGEDEFVETCSPVLMEFFNGVNQRKKVSIEEVSKFCRAYYKKEQGKA